MPTPNSSDGNFQSTSLHKQYAAFIHIPMLSNPCLLKHLASDHQKIFVCPVFKNRDSDLIKKKYLLQQYSKNLAVIISVCVNIIEAQAVRAGWEMNRQKGKQTMTKQTGSDVFIVLHRTQEVKHSITFIALQWLPEQKCIPETVTRQNCYT